MKIEREAERTQDVEPVDVRHCPARIIITHDPEQAPTETLIEAGGRAGYAAKAGAS